MNKPINWYGLYTRIGYWAYVVSAPARWILLSHTHRGYAWLEHDARVLLVKNWFGNGAYSLPGGGIHGWERAIDGVRREIHEELKIEVSHLEFLTEGFRHERFGGKHYILFFHKVNRPLAIHSRRSEITDAKWIPISEVEKGAISFTPEVALAFEAIVRSSDEV